MFVTGFSYTDFVVFLRKDSCIIRIKKDEDYELKSVPLLEKFYESHIVPEMLQPQIMHHFFAKEILTDIVNNVIKNIDSEHIQKELDQLSMPSSTNFQ